MFSSDGRLDISFPGSLFDLGPARGATFIEHTGNHQLVLVDYDNTLSRRAKNIPEMTPVRIVWGDNLRSLRAFYGYLNHSEVISEEDDSLVRLFVIGTSVTMNSATPSSWQNVTGSYIAGQVALRNGLRAVVHKSPRMLPYWAQGNDSDFQMMDRLAKDSGYQFWVDGATLYFLDPNVLINSARSQFIPVFTKMARDPDFSDDLLDIHLESGSLRPGGTSTSLIYGLDAQGRLIQSTTKRVITEQGLSVPSKTTLYAGDVSSYYEADQIAGAHVSQGVWATLKASVRNGSSVKTGGLVYLDGDYLHTDFRGYWVVTGTNSALTRYGTGNAYSVETELELVRNQADRNQFRTTTQSTGARTEVPAVLRSNGRWESETLEIVHV